MKKLISLSVLAFLVISFFAVSSTAANKKTQTTISKSA